MNKGKVFHRAGRINTDARCARCGGNMYIDKDFHGWYEQCLQCGFIHDLEVLYKNEGKAKTDETGK